MNKYLAVFFTAILAGSFFLSSGVYADDATDMMEAAIAQQSQASESSADPVLTMDEPKNRVNFGNRQCVGFYKK